MENNNKTKYNKVPVTKEPVEASDIKKAVAEKPAPAPKRAEWGEGTVYNCQNLNFRKSPVPDSEIIRTIKAGSVVKVDPDFKSPEWSHVKYMGDTGYVMSKYLVR